MATLSRALLTIILTMLLFFSISLGTLTAEAATYSETLSSMQKVIHSEQYGNLLKRGLILDQLHLYQDQLKASLAAAPDLAKNPAIKEMRAALKLAAHRAWKGEFTALDQQIKTTQERLNALQIK